ncbi:MAG TPA: MFS transporter [Arenimonas sp.]|nr:MFS transporter [Arenimonas sp.]
MENHNQSLSRKDINTLGLSALGGALEYYDFIIFVFLAASIGQLFFPPDMPEWLKQLQVFGIFAAGYLARPIGGLLMAHYGDLIGRKRMFTFSLFLMAVPTFIMGLLPTYAQIGIAAPILLLLMRILQGAAVGGEIPGACVFVSEHVPKKYVGLASGTLFSGFTTGILLGSLVAMAINKLFPAQAVLDYAWRLPFLLGGVFGVFALYLRRWLQETPVFIAMKAEQTLANELPLKKVWRDHKAEIWPSMLLTWFLSAGIVTVTLLTPSIMQSQFQYSAYDALLANSLAIVALTAGCIFWGWWADKIGAYRVLVIGATLLAITSFVFYRSLPGAVNQTIVLNSLLGFSLGTVAVVPMILVALFPPVVRYSGFSFSYNVAYSIFGGFTPILISLWMKNDVMAPSYYLVGVCVLAIVLALYLTARAKVSLRK